MKIDHIGIAVKDLAKANKLYTSLLGTPPYREEFVESEQVTTSFFKTGESKVELLASDEEGNVINRFIKKRGEGMHHIAFEVLDLEAEINRLTKEGFTFLSKVPKRGADHKRIVFLHPKDCSGVLIELCESISS